ncbi:serine/threonine-protein kinase [Paludisphaera soli]|uniref:serine/threonine-protein kinase n=1 Tax=Paludisphaera soli TaxID=2712865 RepID=UPI0013EDB437|nr:serine/threonine-protein kinase [Paludisphaera soli]
MSEECNEQTEGPSPSKLDQFAEACARFESAWRRGERPRIEESLGLDAIDGDELLEQLLSLEVSLRVEAGEPPSPDEYLARFPGSRGIVEAAFAEQSTAGEAAAAPPPSTPSNPPGRPPEAPPGGGSPGGSSHNLLIGILGLQNGFIDHIALIAAIQEWSADKRRPIGAILLETGKLDTPTLALLEALATEHRRRHGDDLPKSLAAFGAMAPVLRAVKGLGDEEVAAGLTVKAPSGREDPDATTSITPEGGEEAADEDLAGEASASRFQVLSFHNAGALGKVFLALDKELHRNVALKEIQEKHVHHPVNRDQFVLEGMVTGALEHPGIVPVYSLGKRRDGRLFYAMRFIQGPSLTDKLKQLHGSDKAKPLAEGEAPPTLPKLLRHFVQACQAMAYAHNRRILHRDLKPDHVMLGPFGETLVVDWGLAMTFDKREGEGAGDDSLKLPIGRDSAFSADGVVVGTLSYMSPEQGLGLRAKMGPRSDVFALGAILYAILTGRAPYADKDDAMRLAKVRRGDFPRPSAVRRDVPPALEAICLKAMQFDPDDRYESAAGLARDVEHWLDDEPTLAYPEPWNVRAGRWLRRHRTAAVAAATLATCTLLALAALNVQARRANATLSQKNDQLIAARDAAEEARGQAVEAREEAETNFRDSLAVVQNLLIPVAAEDLPTLPGTTALRRTVASEATKFLEKLWKQKPEDPGVRVVASSGYRELANILRLLGRDDGAPYRRAVGLLEPIVKSRPDEPSYRDALAETLQDYAGSLQLAGKEVEAGPLLRRALELTIGLREQFPDSPAYLRTEARVHNYVANQRLAVGDFAEAARLAENAVRITKDFADSDKAFPNDHLEMILYLDSQGEALLGLARPEEAAAALGEAIRRAEALSLQAPTDDVGFVKSQALMKRARALAAIEGRGDDAKATIDEAVAGFDRLLRLSPEIVLYTKILAEAHLDRAALHVGRQAPAEARNDLNRALGLAEGLLRASPKRPAYSSLLGRVVGRLGLLDAAAGDPQAARPRLTRAVELLDVSLAANPKNPADLKARAEFDEAMKAAPDAPE